TNGINDPAFVNEVTPTKAISTFVSGLHFPGYMAFDGDGTLYISEDLENNNVETPEVIKVTVPTGSVPFSFNSTAISGVAFSDVAPSPLIFGIGQTTKDITGTLIPDPGPSQTMVFRLGTPTGGATLGSPSVNTLTINEPALVQFGTGGESVSQGAGTFSIP